ncbi:MAG TPA: hybrid sensor histidine kinase/response regulator [Polyangiaceae bacterium]|nr:hybrid sensor histidine kinase/response regulator [Polyangiaceae bacterium]
MSILAVDDLPANLVAIEAIVGGLGHDVVAVRSGVEALGACAAREFAAIVLDVAMPGLDGFDTLQRLRELPSARATPVIFSTAHRVNPALMRRANALGAVDYLEKPVAIELLKSKLAAFIALFRQRQEIARQQEALRIKDRHMGILAHDLRAPLLTALQSARALQHHPDLGVRVVAERITRSMRQLEQLSCDMLASAQSATSVQLKRQPVELSSLVEETVDDYRATYGSTRFSTALACDVLGRWDGSRIRQALWNLLGNAVKYGDGWVAVETRSGQGLAWIMIENGGRPLSPEQRAFINAPFSAPPPPHLGMGLGLGVAKEIALAHGGLLRAESSRKGTRFVFQLPQPAPLLGERSGVHLKSPL